MQRILSEVIILRMILILLLVMFHAFAPFAGAWADIPRMEDVPSYYWIAKASYSFMLESFVFISGYVIAHQVQTRGKTILKLSTIVAGKAKRLLLPSIVFSIVYYFMFYDIEAPITSIVYKIINGCGHMWFLPMLFWCFIFLAVVEKCGLALKWKLALVVLLTFMHVLPFPLRVNSALQYFLFFYVGYQIKQHDQFLTRHLLNRVILVGLPVFLIAFISTNCLFDSDTAMFAEKNSLDTKHPFRSHLTLIGDNMVAKIFQ